ncbi:MAG: hypothetical protein VST68_03305 [Nitrospirota bacterium]|nr:hypothetical protein [Nitrospirota bacterium]
MHQSTTPTPLHKLLSLILIGSCLTMFCPESIQAKKKKTHHPLAVFDSRGTKVGIIQGKYIDRAASLWVTVILESYPIVLQVTHEALKAPDNVEGLYLSLDCSGDPFFRHSQTTKNKRMFPLIFITSPGQTVYLASQGDNSIFIVPQSRRQFGRECETLPLGLHLKLRPGRMIGDLESLYIPPFSIR